MQASRTRGDLCPGALRPWPADDGLLVRLRLIGGALRSESLVALLDVAETFGDGHVHVTSRANLQVRGLPGSDGRLTSAALTALVGTGLLPSLSHELVRNVMLSPQSGLAGGRADLRSVAAQLDAILCADPVLARLPGKFLCILDDGRGDLLARSCDLGLVALDGTSVQLRIGRGWGPVVRREEAAGQLAGLARDFLTRRGEGPSAAWHVDELERPLAAVHDRDPRLPTAIQPLPFGPVPGGRHVPVPETGLARSEVQALTESASDLVVTPWRGVLVPAEGTR